MTCLHYDVKISKCAIFTKEQSGHCDGSAARSSGKGCYIDTPFCEHRTIEDDDISVNDMQDGF